MDGKKIGLWAGLFLTAICSCKGPIRTDNAHTKHAPDDFPESRDTLRRLSITWSKNEYQVSSPVYFAEYGRVRRIAGDTLALVYHFGPKENEWDNIAMRTSFDNGLHWNQSRTLIADSLPKKFAGFSTPDLLLQKNGWLLLAYTGRGIPDDTAHCNLQTRISKDKGKTWSKPCIAAMGRSWEPGMVQLDNGEIQLFFSNEMMHSKKAKGRPEQKVLMVSSNNNGQTWSRPRLVAFTPKVRDGMPVPLLLRNNKGIVIPVEAVENHHSPEIIWSSLKANWNYERVGTVNNGRRWYASVDPIWGGAPSLVQLPSGETIISMQTEAGRKIDRYRGWKKNSVVVMVGNDLAKNFGNLSWPYPDLPVNEGRYFCSLFLKDPQTLVLISTRNFPNGRSAIFWKEGKISRSGEGK